MTRFSMRLFVLLAVLCWASVASAQSFTYSPPLSTLSCSTCVTYIRSSLANDSAANGGSLAFSDPLRNLSTTTFLLESSTAATGGTDVGFTLNSIAALAASDTLFLVNSAGTEKFRLTYGGAGYFAGALSTGGNFTVDPDGGGVYAEFITPNYFKTLSLKGRIADGATAIAVKVMSSQAALETDGSKILGLYSDGGTTLRAYFSNLGAIRPGNTAVAAAPAQPYACAAGHDGEIIYVRDTDVGAGAKGFLCFCQCDGQASPTCAWAKASDDSTACF